MKKISREEKQNNEREFVEGVHEALVKASKEARRIAEQTGTRFVVYAEQEPEDSSQGPRP